MRVHRLASASAMVRRTICDCGCPGLFVIDAQVMIGKRQAVVLFWA